MVPSVFRVAKCWCVFAALASGRPVIATLCFLIWVARDGIARMVAKQSKFVVRNRQCEV
jgi:hypothetical protein